ncbi:hypothetical protein [Erythrobacter litoralis]|nr:hypothetical protein [Erythrobacter litoralis]
MSKALPILTHSLAALTLALSASSAALGQEKTFIEATSEHLVGAVNTCEAAKDGSVFSTLKIKQQGWRSRGGPSMFGKLPSGASITISDSDVRKKDSCVIIGWVNETSSVDEVQNQVTRLLGLEFEDDPTGAKTAKSNGWNYALMSFTKPDVTDQTRVIIVITSNNASAAP